jgi:hypothetical protein
MRVFECKWEKKWNFLPLVTNLIPSALSSLRPPRTLRFNLLLDGNNPFNSLNCE